LVDGPALPVTAPVSDKQERNGDDPATPRLQFSLGDFGGHVKKGAFSRVRKK